MRILTLLDACQMVYDCPTIRSGNGLNGASVTVTPDGDLLVAFRGTLTEGKCAAADWLQDFDAALVSAEGFPGKVHAGFLSALDSIWGEVFEAIESAEAPAGMVRPLPWNRRVYLCGHSKGGAVAQLAAVRLAALAPVVVTFGSPSVGNAAFDRGYPAGPRVILYEGAFDPVPHLPPAVFGYVPLTVAETRRQAVYPPHLHFAALRQLMGEIEERWAEVEAAHHIETGYRQWVVDGDVPPPTPFIGPTRKAA